MGMLHVCQFTKSCFLYVLDDNLDAALYISWVALLFVMIFSTATRYHPAFLFHILVLAFYHIVNCGL
jgi:hypothetical protein